MLQRHATPWCMPLSPECQAAATLAFHPDLKLIIQIPCLNEAKTLATTVAALPRRVPGFSCVEWLVIDDGSTDATERVARECGVDHVVRHVANMGLAKAFMTGLEAALQLGADVIVNTDADNQYNADDIPALTAPIVDGKADLVIGARPISSIEHFSAPKKALQRLGSWVVRVASGTDVRDAPSGFRAFSRTAAQRLMVFNNYTYTLETIIQAGRKNMAIASVPVRVNEDLRPSRLVKSTASYVKRSLITIVRIFAIYQPFRFFLAIAGLLFVPGLAIGLRFLWAWLSGSGTGHVQSLLLATLLMGSGFLTLLIAFIADLLAANRLLLEDIRFKVNLLTQDDELARLERSGQPATVALRDVSLARKAPR
jgi:glycosyltransferase involved in cell wall biosynthesis